MKRCPGVVIGIVVGHKDPRGEGRVQIKFPTLPEIREYPWAPLATPLAGKNRGMYFLPEKDDEVLVTFEQGDFDHPYIVGFLWNGVDRPPESDHKNRVILTPGGHTLRFEDTDGKKKVILKTDAGHEIVMDDTVPQKITVKTKGGNKVEISDVPPGISITAPVGQVMVQCLQASITATALLSVTAPVTQFSGVVMAPAIVSGAYNPLVPGNIFGL